MSSKENLYNLTTRKAIARITSDMILAGLVLEDDEVIEAAPILKYMKGWKLDRVLKYAERRDWSVEIIACE